MLPLACTAEERAAVDALRGHAVVAKWRAADDAVISQWWKCDGSLLRFVRARRLCVDDAAEMYDTAMAWRAKVRTDEWCLPRA